MKLIALLLSFILSILLLIALADNPYGYYQFLRVATVFLVLFVAYVVYKSNEKNMAVWFFVAIAVLFNPFLPIYLDKSLWVGIDIIVALSVPIVTVTSLSAHKRITKH